MNKSKITSPLLLLLAAMLWGFAFAAQDAASGVPAFALGMSRSILGCIFLLPVIAVFDKIRGGNRRLVSKRGIDFTKQELLGGALCGVILAVIVSGLKIAAVAVLKGNERSCGSFVFIRFLEVFARIAHF